MGRNLEFYPPKFIEPSKVNLGLGAIFLLLGPNIFEGKHSKIRSDRLLRSLIVSIIQPTDYDIFKTAEGDMFFVTLELQIKQTQISTINFFSKKKPKMDVN